TIPTASIGIYRVAGQTSPVFQGRGDTGTAFNFRTYSLNGYQLSLLLGGIEAEGDIKGTTGTFSGNVTSITPTANNHVATKGYVDGLIPSNYVTTNTGQTITSRKTWQAA